MKRFDRFFPCYPQAKDAETLTKLADKLRDAGVDCKLWVEQPENVPTCLAVKPYLKSEVQSHFKHLKLCKC